MKKTKRQKLINNILVVIIAIGLTIVVGGMFGAIVAYEAFTCFEVEFGTSIIIGAISGLIGGIVIGWHFIEDYGA